MSTAVKTDKEVWYADDKEKGSNFFFWMGGVQRHEREIQPHK